jgi:general secretion pathway protein I
MLSSAPRPDEPGERTDSGFALMETLVALAILSIALGVLLSVFGDGIRQQGQAEQLTMATLHAQSLMARVGADVPLKVGVTTGTLPKGLHWQVLVEHYGDDGDRKAWPAEAYRVVVEVISGEGEQNRPLITLTTLRLGPKEPAR